MFKKYFILEQHKNSGNILLEKEALQIQFQFIGFAFESKDSGTPAWSVGNILRSSVILKLLWVLFSRIHQLLRCLIGDLH